MKYLYHSTNDNRHVLTRIQLRTLSCQTTYLCVHVCMFVPSGTAWFAMMMARY